jgi:hypothetical protein
MKKLDKTTLAERDQIAESLRTRIMDLESSIEGFNTKIAEAWAKVSAAIDEYNTTLDDEWGNGLEGVLSDYNDAVGSANEWKQGVAQQIQDYMDERSEKWQEGEAAQRYQSWKEAFDEDLPTADIERPEDLALEEPDELSIEDLDDAAELLEQLPQELEA